MTTGKRFKRRLLAAALTLVMVCGLLPVTAFADTRIPITDVEATTAESTTPVFGAAREKPVFTVTAGAPAYFPESMINWEKKIDGIWKKQYGPGIFTEGEWRCSVQVRIDGDGGMTHVLAAPLHVRVNGEDWLIGGDPAVGDTYSYCSAKSPEYTVTAPVGTPLTFYDSEDFDIPFSYAGRAIEQVSVAENVLGGTPPYSFGKISGPSWISVSSDGKIDGTPSAIGTNEDLVVRVTDQAGDTAQITIAVAETRMNPDDRIPIPNVEATTAESTTPVFGAAREKPVFTVTAGAPAYFPESMIHWEKKIDGSWEKQYGPGTFTAGEWRCSVQVRIDGDGGTTHMLAAPLHVRVNGEDWLIGGDPAVGDTYSYCSAKSPEYTVIDPSLPVLTGTVSVVGAPVYGETLTASVTDSNNTGTLSYQWKRDGADIPGAHASSYTLVAADVGCRIGVSVKSSAQPGSIASEQTSAVSKANVTVTGLSHTPATVYEFTPIASIVLSGTRTPDAAGTLALNAGQILSAGTNDYSWTFTPADSAVYNSASGTISITVTADAVVSLSASGAPAKTVYEWGDAFETAGLTVTASYASGKTANVTDAVSANTLEVGDTSVTLSYGAQSCTVGGLTVNKKTVDVSGVSWDASQSPFTYDGMEKSIPLTGVPETVNAVKSGDKATNAGSYSAEAALSAADDAHYRLSSSLPVTQAWQIHPAETAGSDFTRSLGRGITAEQSVNASDFGISAAGSFALNGSITDFSGSLDGTPAYGSFVRFKLKASAAAGSTVIVPLTFTPADTNYVPKNVTLTIHITAKDTPVVTVNPITVIYNGSPVPGSAITGSASFGGSPVSGSFVWKGSPAVTNVSDSGSKTVTFVPDDTATYESVDALLTLTIKKAECTGTPAFTAVNASGKTLADAPITAGTLAPAGGTVSWNDPASTAVTQGATYGWTYTPADSANYNIRTGSAVVWAAPVYDDPSDSDPGDAYPPSYAANAPAAEHGTVNASPRYAEAGETVTISAVPDEGYELESLTVTDANGNPVMLTEKDGKYRFVMPARRVDIKASFAAKGTAFPFADVSESDWFYKPVEYLWRQKLMQGTAPDRFDPETEISRAVVATILHRLAGRPEVPDAPVFADVAADSWYAQAVAWAAANRILAARPSGLYEPDSAIPREMLASALLNYSEYRGYDMSSDADLSGFADADSVSPYMKRAMSWAVKHGILNGMNGTHLAPQGTATRSQLAAVLQRYLEKFVK